MSNRDLARLLRQAGQKSLAERAEQGEFGRNSPHAYPMVALQNALACRAVTDRRAEALLTRVRRGEFS